jgi:RHS repeat-associated protein
LAGVILSAAKDRAVQAALTAGQRGRTYSIGQRYPWETLGLVADRQGTTVAAVKPDGTEELNVGVTARDAFGRTGYGAGTSAGAMTTGTGFAGGVSPSAEGGYTYFRNRWYDPTTGRFLTQDPIGLAGGVNLYAYAEDSPVSFSDPWGLCDDPKDPKCSKAAQVFESLKNEIVNAYSRALDRVGAVIDGLRQKPQGTSSTNVAKAVVQKTIIDPDVPSIPDVHIGITVYWGQHSISAAHNGVAYSYSPFSRFMGITTDIVCSLPGDHSGPSFNLDYLDGDGEALGGGASFDLNGLSAFDFHIGLGFGEAAKGNAGFNPFDMMSGTLPIFGR